MARKKKKTRRKILVVLVNLLLIAALAAAAYILYVQASSSLFLDNTILNGYDVSGKTAEEVLLILSDSYRSSTLAITEQGETVLTAPLTEFGCTVDENALLKEIQDCMKNQRLGLLVNLFTENETRIDVPLTVDEDIFNGIVQVNNLSVKRVSSSDAEMVFKNGVYSIKPEVYGNELSDDDLRSLVWDTLTTAEFSGSALTLTAEIPDTLYKAPAKTKDDPEMNFLVTSYNKFCKASITYQFGDETRVLDWDTIKDWVILDEEEGAYIDSVKVYEYVADLGNTYDTLYSQRTITSSSTGGSVTLNNNGYGYLIDRDGESRQLLDNINANLTIEREPIYSQRGFSRSGVDDLNGNYVEVSLTAQHLWFYRNGGLVVSTDIVSGKPEPERETATGVFAIAYKASPFNLKGGETDDKDNSWDVDVKYWMPFHDGQGLHDATWQSSFGGTRYLTNGSHGCINLSLDAAKTIYDYMEAGIPILIYK